MLFGHEDRIYESADARRILTAVPRVIGKGRQDVLTPPGWSQWRTNYHTTTSVWKMPLSWHWTDHSGGYWQQALNRCKPNDDNDNETRILIERTKIWKICFFDCSNQTVIGKKQKCLPLVFARLNTLRFCACASAADGIVGNSFCLNSASVGGGASCLAAAAESSSSSSLLTYLFFTGSQTIWNND